MYLKKNITTLIFAVINLVAVAQITITSADMPNINDAIRVSVKTELPEFDPSATGPNYVWNFLDLKPDSQRVDQYVAPFSTPYFFFAASSYGTRNYNPDQFPFALLGSPPTDAYDFFKETSNFYGMTGQGLTVNGLTIPAFYSSNDILYKFPLNYGNVDSSNSGFTLPLPSIGAYGKKQFRKNTVDGWGTLITPYGTFNTLRIVSEIQVSDSIYLDTIGFGFTIPRQTRYEYKWLGQGMKIPLLQIDVTAGLLGGNVTVDRVVWRDSVITPMSVNILSQSSCPIVNEGSLTASVSGGRHPLKYLWNTGDTTMTISNLAPGLYSVTVTDLYGSSISVSDSVKELNDSTCLMWITFETTETCNWANSGSINATQYGGRLPVSYSWSTGDASEDISNLYPGMYTLTVTDNYGRQATASVSVNAKLRDLECLNIPNAFTPDGDGTNDNWVIKSLNEYTECSVEIFNQWGSMVYKSTGYQTPWDGRFNGEYAPSGTYYFVIKLDENSKEYTGTVTIIK